uniref:Replication factor A C-terminal domain-containing protein n=2 Tax=Ciona intestinalis TaxID=7719 RepID=F6WV89_CIOIN
MPLKSVYGTILSVLDNVFWYNACLKCNTKNVEGVRICQKCKYTGFYFRYRLMIEVDTKYGILPLSCFGNCLKILFGIDAAGFRRELSQIESTEEMLQKFHNCVASCFVGYSFIFQIKNWSNTRHSSCTLVVEKLQHLVGSSELQTVYNKFKSLNTPHSAQNEESVIESMDAHSSLENLEVSSLSKSLSFNKPNTRQRSLSDSMAFLEDTIIRCLFNKSDSVFFERETKSLAPATSTQAVGNPTGSKQDSWFLLNNLT